jgi:hypothetical protein
MQKPRQTAGILTGALLLISIVAIAVPKAEAVSGAVYMQIYNSKTDAEKIIVWKPNGYRFEKKAFIDADNVKVNKISKIFGTTELKLRNTIMSTPQTATWKHFVVTISSDTYRQVKFL